MRSLITATVLAFCILAQSPPPAAPGFGGGYSDLRPEQKRLIDDWFARFSVVVKKQVDPAEGYEKLPLSTKTTFNAVTHALLHTRLTSESGQTLAPSALDLVEKVDSAAGEVLGARGDQQFRLYVQMRPDAVGLLDQSQEFKHTGDNTVYHKGYPTCYRTQGTPSIQISLTRDAARADIDVDYRSSKFPVALINGHLTASNSDVRAGDNDDRHNERWAGLQNWWRNLLGLPLAATAQVGEQVLPPHPREKNSKPGDAVYDFLESWLVEGQPAEAFAYFEQEAFECVEASKQSTADRGMSKFVLVENMLAANSNVGKVSSLKDAVEAVTLTGERIKNIDQPHMEFALYEVREDLAEQFKCENRLDSAEISPRAAKSHDFGKYVGAVFRVNARNEVGRVVATLWQKKNGYWKIISYEVDPVLDRSTAPNVGSEQPAPKLEVVDASDDLRKATSAFLKAWLVKKDVDKALQYVADECLECVTVYRSADNRAPAEPSAALKAGMDKIATRIGAVKNLENAITAPEVYHEALKMVKHRDERAFVLVSIPEEMADAAKCDRRDADGNPHFNGGQATGYGKYYATGFSLNEGSASPAVLWIVWSKASGSWKAVSYVLVTP